jgi:hypothetical protein
MEAKGQREKRMMNNEQSLQKHVGCHYAKQIHVMGVPENREISRAIVLTMTAENIQVYCRTIIYLFRKLYEPQGG